jgi:hypothetical protein
VTKLSKGFLNNTLKFSDPPPPSDIFLFLITNFKPNLPLTAKLIPFE